LTAVKLAIIGQGAIGSLFAYYWRALSPSILVRQPRSGLNSDSLNSDTTKQHRLTMRKPKLLHLLEKPQSFCLDFPIVDITTPQNKAFDALLITVKCYQVEALIADIKSWLSPKTVLVLVQNGMGGAALLQAAFPNNPLVVGTCTDGVFTLDAQSYQHTAQGKLDIGFYNNNASLTINGLLGNAWLVEFCDFHPNPNIHDNIQNALYRKLAVNAVINPLTACLEVKNGELVNYPEKLARVKQEVFVLFDSMNIDWRSLKFNETIDSVIASTANNYSSMQQDVQYKRRTEIEGVLGFLLTQGTKKGVNTPFLKSLYQRILSLETK